MWNPKAGTGLLMTRERGKEIKLRLILAAENRSASALGEKQFPN